MPPATKTVDAQDFMYHQLPPLNLPSPNSRGPFLPPCRDLERSLIEKRNAPSWGGMHGSTSPNDPFPSPSYREKARSRSPRHAQRMSWLQQGRDHDGRFLRKGAVPSKLGKCKPRKQCGWCSTSDTIQWRAGSSCGSKDMQILCNACGINYRRAVAKEGKHLNLDRLAQLRGDRNTSIQKCLNRSKEYQRQKMSTAAPKDSSGKKMHSQQPCWLQRILCEA